MESFYIHDQLAIINFTDKYLTNYSELLESKEFEYFLVMYIQHLKETNYDLYTYLNNVSSERRINKVIKFLKVLTVLELDEIKNFTAHDREIFIELIEDGYLYWRNFQRFSILDTKHKDGYVINSFLEADDKFNQLIISFYRLLQEKLQGTKNLVYRQMHSGTNGSLMVVHTPRNYPDIYQSLNEIPLISQMMLRTPLIIHPHSNKRKGIFSESDVNPIYEVNLSKNDYLTLPMWVADSLCLLTFHKDYLASAIGCANLFQLADIDTCVNKKPDCIILFGIDDDKKDTIFYHDSVNDIWVGKISRDEVIDYFGYFKKMALTLHNLRNIHRDHLPIHGAMVELTFKDGTRKGVVLMGDSGAGKSETIATLTKIAGTRIDHQEVIFDDMGCLYLDENNQIKACGTEIGAFVRLDDLDAGTAYKDMDRSIFFNPETSNARVVMPTTAYSHVIAPHKVDVFLYANNYDENDGIELFDSVQQAKPVFKLGRRFALGTTNEVGISDTYFANPFGPMQSQDLCDPLIDNIFTAIKDSDIKLGQIFTHLGRPDKSDQHLENGANALLNLLQQDK